MSAPRICPKCTDYTTLRPRVIDHEDKHLEIDVCSGCRGVWLDWDEPGLAHELRALLGLPPSGTSFQRDQQRGVCPACDPAQELVRIPVGAFGIDRCPACDGLWFDGGELGPLLTDQGFAALLHALRTHPV